jgi:hypothetical protein
MIIIPNASILAPRGDREIAVGSSLSGHFTMHVLKADQEGRPIEASRRKVAEFDNLILDQGLNRIGLSDSYLGACQVGTGSVVPTNTDSQLASFLTGTTVTFATPTLGAQASPPHYGFSRHFYQFGAGVAAGNLSEVGVGWGATGAALFSRALIVDGVGTPTTITVLSDEILQVTYELRIYPAIADATQVVNINGTNHTFTVRPSRVTESFRWSNGGSASANSGCRGGISESTIAPITAFSGGINAITSSPSGTASNRSSVTNSVYSAGTYLRDGQAVWAIGVANFGAGGIQSLEVPLGNSPSSNLIGNYQIGLSPAIPKISTQELRVNFRHTWARRAI